MSEYVGGPLDELEEDEEHTCAGCIYWDGIECRNSRSDNFLEEIECGCEDGEWE